MNDDTIESASPTGAPGNPEDVLQKGALLTPKYEVIRLIGSGGMGVVYEARNRLTHARVAIKMLHARVRDDIHGAVARFAREARASGQLRSAHVARVLDADTTADHLPFLVMEFYEGTDLRAELERRSLMEVTEICGHLLQACAGLAEAHAAGIIHRDLKPSNLFIAREGAVRRLRILDFGISKHIGAAEELTETSAALGTPHYMAPEQVRDAKSVDHRADVWALGVILYRAITGQLPFRGTATAVAVSIAVDTPTLPRSLLPGLPAALEAVVLRALAKNPDDRFSNVAELADALAPFADAEVARAALAEIALHRAKTTPPPPNEGGMHPANTSARRSSRAWWLVAPVVAIAGMGAAWLLRAPASVSPLPAPFPPQTATLPASSTKGEPSAVAPPSVTLTSPRPAASGSASASVSPSAKPSKGRPSLIKSKKPAADPELLP